MYLHSWIRVVMNGESFAEHSVQMFPFPSCNTVNITKNTQYFILVCLGRMFFLANEVEEILMGLIGLWMMQTGQKVVPNAVLSVWNHPFCSWLLSCSESPLPLHPIVRVVISWDGNPRSDLELRLFSPGQGKGLRILITLSLQVQVIPQESGQTPESSVGADWDTSLGWGWNWSERLCVCNCETIPLFPRSSVHHRCSYLKCLSRIPSDPEKKNKKNPTKNTVTSQIPAVQVVQSLEVLNLSYLPYIPSILALIWSWLAEGDVRWFSWWDVRRIKGIPKEGEIFA